MWSVPKRDHGLRLLLVLPHLLTTPPPAGLLPVRRLVRAGGRTLGCRRVCINHLLRKNQDPAPVDGAFPGSTIPPVPPAPVATCPAPPVDSLPPSHRRAEAGPLHSTRYPDRFVLSIHGTKRETSGGFPDTAPPSVQENHSPPEHPACPPLRWRPLLQDVLS